MDMLEKSQDEQSQRLEDTLRTAVEHSAATFDSAPSDTERSTSSAPIHHVYITSGVWRRLRCDCTAARRRPLSESIARP